MKSIQVILVALCLPLLPLAYTGCAGFGTQPSVQIGKPGKDPILVNAQKTTAIAVDAISTFLKIERDNQVWVKAHAPQIHTYANYLRANAKHWISTSRTLEDAYEANRTADNKVNLSTAISVLTTAIDQIKVYQPQLTNHQ